MATFPLVYSSGNARVKEISGAVFNDAGSDSLDFSIAVNLNGAVVLGGSATFDAGGNVLSNLLDPSSAQDAATKAYVDARVATTDYTVVSATGLTVGKLVALDASNVLILADKDTEAASKAIGVITAVNGTTITVAAIGQHVVSDLSAFSVNDDLFVGDSGDVVAYSSLASGDFVTLVGYVSDVGNDKATLQIRTFGEKA
jgi:hypothetical protein